MQRHSWKHRPRLGPLRTGPQTELSVALDGTRTPTRSPRPSCVGRLGSTTPCHPVTTSALCQAPRTPGRPDHSARRAAHTRDPLPPDRTHTPTIDHLATDGRLSLGQRSQQAAQRRHSCATAKYLVRSHPSNSLWATKYSPVEDHMPNEATLMPTGSASWSATSSKSSRVSLRSLSGVSYN